MAASRAVEWYVERRESYGGVVPVEGAAGPLQAQREPPILGDWRA